MKPIRNLNTEKLIKLVSKYPELYDGKHKDYGDLHQRETIWQRIAKELNVKAELCKAKWNILRGGYRRALRNKESGYSFGARKWRFEDDLSFLKECVMERRRPVCNDADGFENGPFDNEDEFITIVKEEPSEIIYEAFTENIPDDEWMSSCGSITGNEENEAESSSKMSKNHQGDGTVKKEEKTEVDGVTQLFLSLAETVKALPLIAQAKVKAEVFKAVNEAEMSFLQGKSQCSCKHGQTTDHTYVNYDYVNTERD